MRSSRWLMAGLGVAFVLAGCTESSKLTLAELERHKREVDKQMRLVREQNEQINTKLNLLKAQMDTITTVYIPAVGVKLDSVAAKPEQARIQMISEVENRLSTMTANIREFKTQVTETVTKNDKDLNEKVTSTLKAFQDQVNGMQQKVEYVLTQQDSVNREFAVRIDKRPWYRSILGTWDDQQRQKTGGTP